LNRSAADVLRILVPLDGSPVAESALHHAAALARAFACTVCLVRVIEPDARFWASTDTVDWRLRRRQTEAYLRRMAGELGTTGVATEWRLEEGRAADVISDLCRDGEFDLVVMTRYGRGGAGAFRFGGTVQKVIFSVPSSVLVVDPESGAGDGERSGYSHILVPTDGSLQSEWALGIAAMIAQAHGGRVTLLQVIERPVVPRHHGATVELKQLTDRMTELRYLTARRRSLELAARLPGELIVSSEVTIADDAALAIERFARNCGADIIVMSAHGAARSSPRSYGDVSRALLEQSPCPVLVCRPPEPASARNCFQSALLAEPCADAG
jgi:nucleotide-binding universal stress UspA family protein